MNRVRELRKRAGMQQKELAIALGITRPTISDWERNKKDPGPINLKKLSEIFGVSTGVILAYEDVPNPVPVIFVDDGSSANQEIVAAREQVQRDPERGELFAMATRADIMSVRRAIAVLKALETIDN